MCESLSVALTHSTGPHGANLLQSISLHSQRKYTALFMLQGPPLFSNVRTAERRREIELIFYFPWQFRGFYEFKEKTPQSQQMVVGIRVFLTICNSPHLEMFCGHPLCPQDCICPHIIKVCIENSLALLARYKCFDTGTAPPSHQTQSRRFTFQNTTPSIYLFFIYPAKWIFFLSLALKPSILLPQRGASVRCR